MRWKNEMNDVHQLIALHRDYSEESTLINNNLFAIHGIIEITWNRT